MERRNYKAVDEIIFGNVNRPLHFIQIPSKRLKKDTGTQVNNSTFIFIADKVFRFPVARTLTTICPCLDTVVNDCWWLYHSSPRTPQWQIYRVPCVLALRYKNQIKTFCKCVEFCMKPYVKFKNLVWFHWWVEFYVNFSVLSIDQALKNSKRVRTGLEIWHDSTMGIGKKTKSCFRLSDPVIPINNEPSLIIIY